MSASMLLQRVEVRESRVAFAAGRPLQCGPDTNIFVIRLICGAGSLPSDGRSSAQRAHSGQDVMRPAARDGVGDGVSPYL